MRRLNRYLSRTVLFASLGSLLVLVFIVCISMLVAEMQDLKGDYTLNQALLYVMWRLPNAIYENLTFAAFLGCVIGLGIHANANELVVIRAAGVGMRRVVWAAMRPVLGLTLVGILWGEYVTPVTLQLAEGVKASAQSDRGALSPQSGIWYLEDNAFLYFNGLNRKLYNVTQYQLGDDRKQMRATEYASEATYYSDGWQLEDGKVSRFIDAGDENSRHLSRHLEQQRYARRDWRTDLTPALLNDLVLPPEALSIRSLYRYAQGRDRQGLESQTFWLSFWQKITQPLVVISLALVGMSFVFGSLREANMGLRLTVAVMVGIIFTILQEFAASSSLVFHYPPLLAVFIPILAVGALGAWMLRHR